MVVGEGRLGLALGPGQRVGEFLRALDHAHALAAAAGRGLDQHRKTDAIGFLGQQVRRLVVIVIARHQRHLGLFHDLLGFTLGTHGADGGRRRADEDEPRLGASLGEAGILGQEPIARMHRLRARAPGGLDDLLGHEIALAGRRGADMHRLVGHRDMARAAVGVGVDGHGLDAEPPRRLDDAAGDLAAIGDQDLGKHRHPISSSPARSPCTAPRSSACRRPVPAPSPSRK